MTEVLRPVRLSGVQRAAVGVSATLGLGLAAYGVAGDPLTKAAELLVNQPDMTGADLGRALGISPRHGLRLKKRVRSDGMAIAAS